MRVTYLEHSGFLVEWEDILCLFDCAGGPLPEMDPDRHLYVFISHGHSDHFNPEIFSLCRRQTRRTFLMSSDIRAAPDKESGTVVIRMSPDRKRVITGPAAGPLLVRTLPSTDAGVAFVVSYAGRTIYHAGDLHWWAWPGDSPEEERDMKNRFFNEIVKIKGLTLAAAFLPLDPRLEGNFWLGFDAVMRAARVEHAFPMHMWGKYDTIARLRELEDSAPYRDRIAEITGPGTPLPSDVRRGGIRRRKPCFSKWCMKTTTSGIWRLPRLFMRKPWACGSAAGTRRRTGRTSSFSWKTSTRISSWS